MEGGRHTGREDRGMRTSRLSTWKPSFSFQVEHASLADSHLKCAESEVPWSHLLLCSFLAREDEWQCADFIFAFAVAFLFVIAFTSILRQASGPILHQRQWSPSLQLYLLCLLFPWWTDFSLLLLYWEVCKSPVNRQEEEPSVHQLQLASHAKLTLKGTRSSAAFLLIKSQLPQVCFSRGLLPPFLPSSQVANSSFSTYHSLPLYPAILPPDSLGKSYVPSSQRKGKGRNSKPPFLNRNPRFLLSFVIFFLFLGFFIFPRFPASDQPE